MKFHQHIVQFLTEAIILLYLIYYIYFITSLRKIKANISQAFQKNIDIINAPKGYRYFFRIFFVGFSKFEHKKAISGQYSTKGI